MIKKSLLARKKYIGSRFLAALMALAVGVTAAPSLAKAEGIENQEEYGYVSEASDIVLTDEVNIDIEEDGDIEETIDSEESLIVEEIETTELVGNSTEKDEATGLSYSFNSDGTCSVISYSPVENGSKTIVIPEQYNGHTVTEIGSEAFYKSDIVSVTIPMTVESIGRIAFSGCKSLKEVKFETTSVWGNYGGYIGLAELKIIDSSAFYGCELLEEIVIPGGVEKIGSNAFDGTGLKSVYLPYSLKELDACAFNEVKNLRDIYYSGNVASWCNIEANGKYAYPNNESTAKKIVFHVADSNSSNTSGYVVAADINTIGAEKIGNGAFYGFVFNTVTVHSATSEIEEYAFEDSVITTFTFSAKTNKIGYKAFMGAEIENLQYDGTLDDWLAIQFSEDEKSADNIHDYPNAVAQKIYFKENGKYNLVTEITIPDKYSSIRMYAFYNFKDVLKFTFSNKLKDIGDFAFALKANVDTLEFSGTVNEWVRLYSSAAGSFPNSSCNSILFNGEKVTEIILDDDIRNVPGGCFENFKDVETVDLNNVSAIGVDAFRRCAALKSIEIPNSVMTIGAGAFSGCSSMESVTIGTGVAVIEKATFNGCYKLTTLTMTDSVQKMYDYEFSYTNLKEVIVPSGSYADSYFTELNSRYSDSEKIVITYDQSSGIYLYQEGCSAWFDGNIGMTFYYRISDNYIQNDSMYLTYTVSLGDTKTEYKVKADELKKAGAYYTFDVILAPKDVNAEITFISERKRAGRVIFKSTSFISYCEKIIDGDGYKDENGEDTPIVTVVRALLTYCDAAQTYFDCDKGSIDSKYLSKAENTYTTDFSDYKPEINDSGCLGMSLTLGSSIQLKIYLDGERKNLWCGQGERIYGGTQETLDKYYIYGDGYTAFHLDDFKWGKRNSDRMAMDTKYTVQGALSSRDSSNTIVFYGIYSYFYLAEKSDNENLKKVGYAIYNLDETLRRYSNTLPLFK